MKKKPNLLLFNPDQWRGDVLGHMGNPAALTPVLDRMVKEDAVSFSAAFCQNPVCTPSRCSFMTGWYPHVRGHRTMHHMLHPELGEPNLLKVLKDNGYFIWWAGKNDLVPGGSDLSQYCDVRFQATEEDFKRWNSKRRPGSHGGDPSWRGDKDGDNFFSFMRGRLDKEGEEIYCDGDYACVLGARDFIESYKGDQPFCIFLTLSNPHPPYCIEDPYYDMIDRSKLPRRAKAPEDWKGKCSLMKGLAEGQQMGGWTEERWSELRATYYGMCARLDEHFGMLMDTLRKTDTYDDTAVILFSDHGDFTGDYGLVEKAQNTFEDCLSRVPFIVKPPKDIPVKPRVSPALVELVDLSETVYELSGIDPDYDRFGKSVVPLLAGESDAHRDAVFCEGGRLLGEVQAMERESLLKYSPEAPSLYWPRMKLQTSDDGPHPYHGKAAMCRTATHKYVRRLYEADELYDLTADPMEEHNCIDDPSYAEVLTALKERMTQWYMETCDVVPRQIDQRGGPARTKAPKPN